MTSAGTWSELQLIVLDHLVQVRPGRDIHVEHDDRNDSFIAGFVSRNERAERRERASLFADSVSDPGRLGDRESRSP